MKIAITPLTALTCCLVMACSDGGDDPGGLGGGSTAGVGGSSAGTSTVAGNSSGGSGASTAGASGTGTSGGSGGTSNTSGGSGSGSGSGGTSNPTAGSAGTAGSGGAIPMMTEGETLYTANCKMCHGEQGNGGKDGPDVKHPIRDYSKWVVRNGRAQTSYPKPMEKVGMDKLSDAQLTLIFDYLDTPPQPTTGAALYGDYCLACHGADGKGGPTTRNITGKLDGLKNRVRKGANNGQFDMRKEYMPAFTTMRLSDADLEMVYDHVDTL